MKQSKQIIKELALLFGFALGILLVLTLIAGVRSRLGGSFGGSLWRLGAFIGAIIWLLAAVFLLSGRLGRKKMKLWTENFPHSPFAWALILVGAVLILLACLVNYFVI